MIDLHAHVLPGVDDGPPSLADAVALCRGLADEGVRAVVAAPHMRDGAFDVSRERALAGVAELRAALAREGVSLDVQPGGEVRASGDLLSALRSGELLTIGDLGRHLLLELPRDIVPPGFDQLLFSMQLAGVKAVLTHPERHGTLQQDADAVESFARGGTLIQVTAASLTGRFGPEAERSAKELVGRRLAHVVASDAHNLTVRALDMRAARRIVCGLVGDDEAENMFSRRPAEVIAGRDPDIPDPTAPPTGGLRGWMETAWRKVR